MSDPVQQPLYAEGWRDTQDHMRRPGETDAEYYHRQLDQARAILNNRARTAPSEDTL